jgi:hypothetical protein
MMMVVKSTRREILPEDSYRSRQPLRRRPLRLREEMDQAKRAKAKKLWEVPMMRVRWVASSAKSKPRREGSKH